MSKFNYVALAQDLSKLVGREVSIAEARAVKRDIERHQSLQEARCNAELTKRQIANEAGVEHRLGRFFGDRLRTFNGDPRGATVKLYSLFVYDGTMQALVYFTRDLGGDLIFTGYR